MKKTTAVLLSALGVMAILVSCKGKDMASADPKTVLTQFMERLAKKDIAGASKLATKESQATMNMVKMGMGMAEKMKGYDKESKEIGPMAIFNNVEIGDAKIDGETALVPFKHKTKGTSFDFPLKKEDGAWRVDFNIAALRTLGMRQGAAGLGGDDFIKDSLDFNTEDMQKGLKEVDSLMKSIDPKKIEDLKKALEGLKQ